MPELAIFAIDRSSLLGTRDYAEGFKFYDVIEVKPDGWGWSETELRHPDFRILKWPAAGMAACEALLLPMRATWRAGPLGYARGAQVTYAQPRRSFLDWAHPAASAALPTLAAHFVTRRVPHYFIAASAALLPAIRAERPAIRIEATDVVA